MRYCVKRTSTNEYFKHIVVSSKFIWTHDIEECLQFATRDQAQRFVDKYLGTQPYIVIVAHDFLTTTKNDAYKRAMGVI